MDLFFGFPEKFLPNREIYRENSRDLSYNELRIQFRK